MGTYAPSAGPDQAAARGVPWQEAYHGVIQQALATIAITFSLAALAGMIGFFVARRLSVPLVDLTQTAARIAEGDKTLLAAVAGPAEVAGLASAFNSMTNELRRSVSALEGQIQEVKRAEKSLRESEERLLLSLEGASEGIFDCDLRSGQMVQSKRSFKILGYTWNEFPAVYEGWRELIHPEDLVTTERAVKRAVNNGTPFAYEFRARAKDGRWAWVQVRGKVMERDQEGKPVRVAGSYNDITARKRAEETLRKYEQIVSVSQDLLCLSTCDYILEAANDSYLRYRNRTREEILGRPIAEIVGEGVFQEKIRPWFDQALAGQTVRYRDHMDYEGCGSRFMEFTYSPVTTDSGRVLGAVMNARDITDTRRLEEQLIHSQKIESIGTLAGGVAHEINNPINGIMNYAQLISEQIDEGSPARELAQEIIHETERIAQIVRNLLTFARHEKQSHSTAHLSEIVSSVLSLIRTVMRHDQIELQVDIPEDLPHIQCRSQQIQQVLMNLITNARDGLNERYHDYSPEKKLTLSARVLSRNGRKFLRATVEDRGIGIPPEIRARIFDPFFTTKPKEIGTGLGLSISYSIVKDHGGELTVESEPGRSTRFHMDLPVDDGSTLPDRVGGEHG